MSGQGCHFLDHPVYCILRGHSRTVNLVSTNQHILFREATAYYAHNDSFDFDIDMASTARVLRVNVVR